MEAKIDVIGNGINAAGGGLTGAAAIVLVVVVLLVAAIVIMVLKDSKSAREMAATREDKILDESRKREEKLLSEGREREDKLIEISTRQIAVQEKTNEILCKTNESLNDLKLVVMEQKIELSNVANCLKKE